MPDPDPVTSKRKYQKRQNSAQQSSNTDPTKDRNLTDPGDATGRNFRYQHAYGIIILVAAKRGQRPYTAIWCEQHEDFLAQRTDGLFDGYQIKTSRPERGAWTLRDSELIKSIGRFIDLVKEFGYKIGDLYFVSNKEFDEVAPNSKDEKRRGRSPKPFLSHIRNCGSRDDIEAPFLGAFDELQATCGCDADQLLAVLHRMDLIVGPSRGEFDATISNEHLASLDECRACSAEQLNAFRDKLISIIYQASSLQVTDPIRHLRPLINASELDPVLVAKKIIVAEIMVYEYSGSVGPDFSFPGESTLNLNASSTTDIVIQKFEKADLEDQIDFIITRSRAAEYNLLEDVLRRPSLYPKLLQQIEQRVLGELSEAHLRARLNAAPYGPAMLIDAQDRLRRTSHEMADKIGNHNYDCLIGVAGLLTGECRVWWGPRFPLRRNLP